jgi:hypothetical protein
VGFSFIHLKKKKSEWRERPIGLKTKLKLGNNNNNNNCDKRDRIVAALPAQGGANYVYTSHPAK